MECKKKKKEKEKTTSHLQRIEKWGCEEPGSGEIGETDKRVLILS